MSGIAIAPLREDEVRAGARLLARAFCENAMNRVVVPGSAARRERSNEAGMRAMLPLARESGSVLAARADCARAAHADCARAARADCALAGVLIALPAGVTSAGRPSWGALLRLLIAQGPGVAGRWSAVAEALLLHRPVAPHAYLATLGVAPERQRTGVGRALLGHWLAAVDAQRQRAYLETDSTRNVTWYESFGFTRRAELEVLGVTVHLMERAARDG